LAGLVVDASVAVAAVLEEAHTEAARAILRRVANVGAVVPNLWHFEVGQTLLVAERHGRLTAAERETAQSLLLDLPVAVDAGTWARAMRDTIELASEQRLSLYDAAYLELSRRSNVPLATFDADLRRAAAAIGVVLL
jgi:predicted nucleic acid-binding protein